MADDDLFPVLPNTQEGAALLLAMKIEALHGDRGAYHIERMVERFTLEGDEGAAGTYREIGKAFQSLLKAKGDSHH